jgi:biotin carboxyl carrier protein
MKYIITINQKNYEVEVEKGEARVLSVTAASTPIQLPVAEAVPTVPVGSVAAAPVALPSVQPAAPVSGAGEALAAPMPGTVISLQKNLGDKVKSGDIILILEAMKMENEIVAMNDGTITQILVSKGSIVKTGDPLVMIL